MLTRLAVVALATAALAGCGDDGSEAASGAAKPKAKPAEVVSSVVELTAPDSGRGVMRFDKKKLTAKAGLVELRLDNQDPGNTHNIRIQTGKKCCDPARDIGGTESIDGPDKITGRVKLEPGTYWFICGLIGHFDGDLGKMKGKLVVQ